MVQRIKELESIRGLAALSVVIYHCLLVFPLFERDTFGLNQFWLLNLLKYSPLRVVSAGYQAVLLFFLLSGFVLSLPFYAGKAGSYSSFLVRRICRIYLPYLGAVGLAVVLDALCSRHGIDALSGWFNRAWRVTPEGGLIIQHLWLIGSFDSNEYDPVLWSLVQEMRLSLVFPLLMLAVNCYSWKFMLGVAVSVGGFGGFLFNLAPSYSADLLLTLEYAGLFIVGALLAKHRRALVRQYHRLPRWGHYVLFAGAITCYTAAWWLYGIGWLRMFTVVTDFIEASGAVVLLMLGLASSRVAGLLLREPLPFLGRISYSLYLYHAIVLLAAVNLLYGSLPLPCILLLAFFMAVLVAVVAHYSIEVPAIALGAVLSTRGLLLSKRIAEKWRICGQGRSNTAA